MFFFEKKNQKTFVCLAPRTFTHIRARQRGPGRKGFFASVLAVETSTQSSGAIVPVSPLNAALRVIWHDSRERGVW